MIGRGLGRIFSFGAVAIAMVCALSPVALSQSRTAPSDAPIILAQAQDWRSQQRGQRAAPAPSTSSHPGEPSLFTRQPPPSSGFSLRRLFGLEEPPPQVQPSYRPPRARPKPVARQEHAKPQAENRIVVFGDWLADGLAVGLDDSFADLANIAVARHMRPDIGLLREEWPKIVGDYLDQKQKVTVAVIMLGMTDRLTAPGTDVPEPLSDAWKELYGQRIDALMAVFAAQNIPVVWVGLPPVKDEAASARYAAINAILRERLGHSGVYVDVWPGFVGEDNRYMAAGPDADGQQAKLRAPDGVHFTRKGVDKLATYAAAEIRRLLGAGAGTKDVPTALPGSGNEPFADIDKTVQPPTESGPVVPLTRAEVSPNGVLLKGKTDLNAAGALHRAFRAGLPTAPVKGRMDDYRAVPDAN